MMSDCSWAYCAAHTEHVGFTGRSDFAWFLDKNGVPYELFSC